MKKREIIDIANAVNSACIDAGLIRSRCLAASVIIRDVFIAMGHDAELFTCSVAAMSQKFARVRDKVKNLSESQVKELAASGARCVLIMANEPSANVNNPPVMPLYGHVCVVVNVGGKSYFIDPTAYQFKRTKRKNGFIVDAPVILCDQVSGAFWSVLKRNEAAALAGSPADWQVLQVALHGGGQIHYEYQHLDQIAKARAGEISNSDLDTGKYDDITSALVFEFGGEVKVNA